MPGGGKGGSGKGGGEIKITGDSSKPVSFDVATAMDSRSEIGGTGEPIAMRTELGGTDRPLATRTEMGGTGTPLETGMALSVSVPDPIRTETHGRTELAVTEPIETSSDMRLDVKPVVVDLCLTAGIGNVPRLTISRPYDHHFSLRVLGNEIFGLDLRGHRRTTIDHLAPRPPVVWGAVTPGPGGPSGHPATVDWLPGEGSHDRPPTGDGIRIRLGD